MERILVKNWFYEPFKIDLDKFFVDYVVWT